MTEDWDKYEKGKQYNNSLSPNYYATVDTNIDFFTGNQWKNVQSNGQPTPVFNIIKRCITFFVASIMSSKTTIQFEPLIYADEIEGQELDESITEHKHASEIATAEVKNLFEKFKMDDKFRKALFKSAIYGDVAGHFWWEKSKKPYGGNGKFKDIKGEICFELIDGTQIYLGNANNPEISNDTQPYIIISGRDTVENLKIEAKSYQNDKKNKAKDTNIDGITTDSINQDQAGDMGKIEIKGDKYGKATYIIIYTYDTDTETIHVSKCTENVYMYKDIDTELTRYPVAWMNWEEQANTYHGRAISTGIIPNQIFINKMFAMVMYHLMNSAFPKVIYNADKVSPWTNEIAGAIGVKDLAQNEGIGNVAQYLNPAQMSGDIIRVI